MTLEIAIGRALAFCVHPSAAWMRLGPPGRALLVGAYFAAGYTAALTLLLAL